MKPPHNHESEGSKDKRPVDLKEYLKYLYQGYPIPHEGMFVSDYVRLHRLMLDDLREYVPRMKEILSKVKDPNFYTMWLEKTLQLAEKVASISQDYLLVYVFTEEGVQVGWAKTQEIYKRQ